MVTCTCTSGALGVSKYSNQSMHYTCSSFATIIDPFGPHVYIWRALCPSHNCTLLKVYSSIIPRPSRSLLSRCWNIIHLIVSLRERPSDTCCNHSHDQDALVAFKTFYQTINNMHGTKYWFPPPPPPESCSDLPPKKNIIRNRYTIISVKFSLLWTSRYFNMSDSPQRCYR